MLSFYSMFFLKHLVVFKMRGENISELRILEEEAEVDCGDAAREMMRNLQPTRLLTSRQIP